MSNPKRTCRIGCAELTPSATVRGLEGDGSPVEGLSKETCNKDVAEDL